MTSFDAGMHHREVILSSLCPHSAAGDASPRLRLQVPIAEHYGADGVVFTWQSAMALAAFLPYYQHWFASSKQHTSSSSSSPSPASGPPTPHRCMRPAPCTRSLRGLHVLEMGAGTGLPGLVAAQLGAASVTLTDRAACAATAATYAVLHRNVRHATSAVAADADGDGGGGGSGNRVRVRSLEWGSDRTTALPAGMVQGTRPSAVTGQKEQQQKQQQQGEQGEVRERFDVVLAADALYSMEAALPLVRSLDALLRGTGNGDGDGDGDGAGVCLMTYQERSSHRLLTPFLDAFGLRAEAVPLGSFLHPSQLQGGEVEVDGEEQQQARKRRRRGDEGSGGGVGSARLSSFDSVFLLVISRAGPPAARTD